MMSDRAPLEKQGNLWMGVSYGHVKHKRSFSVVLEDQEAGNKLDLFKTPH